MYKTIILEDDPIERDIITETLQKDTRFSIHGSYETFTDAVPHIFTNDIDLALIDIGLPEGDFFSLLEQSKASITDLPYTIFITAHDRYAVNAFDIGAIDYILKPVSEGRFTQSIRRFIEHKQRVVAYLNLSSGPHKIRIPYEDIYYITADGKHSIIHTRDADLDCPRPIGELEEELGNSTFIRNHRKHIVNTTHLSRLSHNGDSTYSVVMAIPDETLLPVGRSYLKQLRDIFG